MDMPDLKKVRSFDLIEPRIEALNRHKSLECKVIGKINRHPFYMLDNLQQISNPKYSVHLTAGIHGDEPAGVEGLLRFMEQISPRILKQVALSVFPCVNVWGYERNSRENKAGQDINRLFKPGANCAEVDLMRIGWGRRQFDLAVTCHEDYDSPGAYVYELKEKHPFFGEDIVKAFSKHVKIDKRPVIEEQFSINGVIRRDLSKLPRGLYPEAIYLVKGSRAHTRHTLTLETPSLQPFEERVAAQIAALKKCFNLLLAKKSPDMQVK